LMQACASLALALLTFIVKAKSWNETLPAPPPVPYANVPLFVSPQEKLATSIAPGCLLSLDSPGTPSITRRTSFGMAFLRSPQPGRTSRAEYLKMPASASSILVRRRDALGAARNSASLVRQPTSQRSAATLPGTGMRRLEVGLLRSRVHAERGASSWN